MDDHHDCQSCGGLVVWEDVRQRQQRSSHASTRALMRGYARVVVSCSLTDGVGVGGDDDDDVVVVVLGE